MDFLNNIGSTLTKPLDFLQSSQNNATSVLNNGITTAGNTASNLFSTVGSSISSITDVFGSLIKLIPYLTIGIGLYLLLTLVNKK